MELAVIVLWDGWLSLDFLLFGKFSQVACKMLHRRSVGHNLYSGYGFVWILLNAPVKAGPVVRHSGPVDALNDKYGGNYLSFATNAAEERKNGRMSADPARDLLENDVLDLDLDSLVSFFEQ